MLARHQSGVTADPCSVETKGIPSQSSAVTRPENDNVDHADDLFLPSAFGTLSNPISYVACLVASRSPQFALFRDEKRSADDVKTNKAETLPE